MPMLLEFLERHRARRLFRLSHLKKRYFQSVFQISFIHAGFLLPAFGYVEI